MTIVYSGRLLLPGNSATTTFEGFYLDSIQVEGTHKVTNTSTQDKRSFTVEVTNAKLTKPNGNFSTWSSNKTITQTGAWQPCWISRMMCSVLPARPAAR
ncbi:hypothetical protein [Paraflavitalea speifideaquila]|uniref:hypothetical protein n=1 Tax=Paraflavitalea speifideaquila TaxID=3076558 RepID=UPI0028EBC523|nr:hypothetical protein [Paraflavitalea speifideiaquila]